MQKWEYVTLGTVNSYGLQYKLNGEKQNQWKDKNLHEVLADLGNEGWELLSYDGGNYIFKRPKISTGPMQPPANNTAAKPSTGSLQRLSPSSVKPPSDGNR